MHVLCVCVQQMYHVCFDIDKISRVKMENTTNEALASLRLSQAVSPGSQGGRDDDGESSTKSELRQFEARLPGQRRFLNLFGSKAGG